MCAHQLSGGASFPTSVSQKTTNAKAKVGLGTVYHGQHTYLLRTRIVESSWRFSDIPMVSKDGTRPFGSDRTGPSADH